MIKFHSTQLPVGIPPLILLLREAILFAVSLSIRFIVDVASCWTRRISSLPFLRQSKSKLLYPDQMRRVRVFDPEQKRFLIFLTNNFSLSAETIASLYKNRWKVELFFKWIKQHLRIKAFFGTSENAVHTQIWISISTYLIIAIKKKELGLEKSLHEILQKVSINLFEKVPLHELLTKDHSPILNVNIDNQLTLNYL